MTHTTHTATALQTLIDTTAKYIRHQQHADGAIPWFNGHKLDPWDHTEAAMGLTIAGHWQDAYRAYQWLNTTQNPDGSWYAKYFGRDDCGGNEENKKELNENENENENEKDTIDSGPQDKDRQKIETNFVAYPATGLWHYYLVTNNLEHTQQLFPMIERAINYVVRNQHAEGDIQWANSTCEKLPKDALVTACASVLRSLECAIKLAKTLGYTGQPTESPTNEKPHIKPNLADTWTLAYLKLADCLKNKPWRFDRTWESKQRFSMDWFYPVLAGIYTQHEAQLRLASRWDTFVNPQVGCRCVSDQPWVTIAESCELTLALIASGQKDKAQTLFQQLLHWQDTKDGGFWTGYNFRDDAIWPDEKTCWTNAAILLALDALNTLTPAATLFTAPSDILGLRC